MSRTISAGMQTHLNGVVTSLVTCWKVELTDGSTVLGFTNHTRPLELDGLQYLPDVGVTPTSLVSNAGTGVDNLEVHSVIDSAVIKEEDLISGKYDFARITVLMVNPDSLGDGAIIMHKGIIGDVSEKNLEFVAEVRGYLQMVSKDILELTSPYCRVVKLGDGRCKVNLGGRTATTDIGMDHAITQLVAVDTVVSRKKFHVNEFELTAFGETYDNFFQFGECVFVTGANAGRRIGVKYNIGFPITLVTLVEETPYDIQPLDEVRFYAGCDRSWTTCRDKFANTLNFRGEPGIPGGDWGTVSPGMGIAATSFFSQLNQ